MERSEEILVACVGPEPIGTLVACLVSALPSRWSMNNICEQDLCPVSTVKWYTLWMSITYAREH